MEEKITREIRISVSEILKKFKIDGQLLSFNVPSRQNVDEVKDRKLLVVVKLGSDEHEKNRR